MARFVIDAPTLLHLVAEGPAVNVEHQLVAPNLIRSQALSLLLGAVQRGEITEAVALDRHERLTELKMRLLNDRVSRTHGLADRSSAQLGDDLRRGVHGGDQIAGGRAGDD